MVIKDFIIHRIDKKRNCNASVTLRTTGLSGKDSKVIKFTEQVVNTFRANEDKVHIYADFHNDTTNHPFSQWCLEYFNGKKNVVQFSTDSTNRLVTFMDAQSASTGGYAIFANVQLENANKLLVVMLHQQDGLSITEQLDLQDVTHLELKQIDKAALIDGPLDENFGPKPLTYAGFRKDMSIYFQKFLGPDVYRNPNRDTHQLIDAIDTYMRDNQFNDAQRVDIRMKLRSYVKNQTDNDEDIELTAIAAIVEPTNIDKFAAYAAAQKISAYIKADPSVLKKWKVVRYESSEGMILQFKAEDCGEPGTDHQIHFDETKNTLTFRDLAPALVKKIKENLA